MLKFPLWMKETGLLDAEQPLWSNKKEKRQQSKDVLKLSCIKATISLVFFYFLLVPSYALNYSKTFFTPDEFLCWQYGVYNVPMQNILIHFLDRKACGQTIVCGWLKKTARAMKEGEEENDEKTLSNSSISLGKLQDGRNIDCF